MGYLVREGPAALKPLMIMAGLLVTACLLLPGTIAAGVPNDVCGDCHDIVEDFKITTHGASLGYGSKWAETSCESCHGSALEHIEEGDPEKIINPARADQFGGNVLCLTCHKSETFDGWMFSDHAGADMTCASCHKVHTPRADPAASNDNELCYSCHADVRAASYMPSHHPLAEGKMTCRDCHNPHGGTVSMVMGESGRDLCLSCHADIEGPHVYEHAPVNEDCGLCHNAHGSVADKLLKQNEPALCLNCHAMHFHATVESVPGSWEGFPTQGTDRVGTSELDSWKSGMLTKCTQCHIAIHGTDLPSQATSTGGNALTR